MSCTSANLRRLIAVSGCLLAAAMAHGQIFTADLDGPSESPANDSPGTGFATVIYDSEAHTLSFDVSFSGLIGNTSNAHIHAPTAVALSGTAGVATQTPTLSGFPSGVTSGTYQNTLDLTQTSSFNASYVTANGGTAAGAESALITAMLDGKAYFNIHSSQFSGGEIRGFLTVTPVPEPHEYAMVAGLGLLGFAAWRRRVALAA